MDVSYNMIWERIIAEDYSTRRELARKLGEILREERLRAGLTQAELAELINVDDTAIRRWELGIRLPSIKRLLSLERAFRRSSR